MKHGLFYKESIIFPVGFSYKVHTALFQWKQSIKDEIVKKLLG